MGLRRDSVVFRKIKESVVQRCRKLIDSGPDYFADNPHSRIVKKAFIKADS